MWGGVFQTASDETVCPVRQCVAMKQPQRGVNDDFVYTSSHTARDSGLTVNHLCDTRPGTRRSIHVVRDLEVRPTDW